MSDGSVVVTDYSLKNIFRYLRDICIQKREAGLIDAIKQYGIYKTADRNSNIFKLYDPEGNDLLALCCINKLEDAAFLIIDDYSDLFDAGLMNEYGETSLIISIVNDLYTVASELLNKFSEDCNPGQITYGDDGLTALDYMLHKDKTVIQEHIDIVANLLDYYVENEPESQVFHRNIDLICQDLEFYKPLLQPYFNTERLDLSEEFCRPPVNAEISQFPILDSNIRNTRNMENNVNLNARPTNLQIGIPANDRNFPDEYTREEENSFRLNKRQRTGENDEHDENRGGSKTTFSTFKKGGAKTTFRKGCAKRKSTFKKSTFKKSTFKKSTLRKCRAKRKSTLKKSSYRKR